MSDVQPRRLLRSLLVLSVVAVASSVPRAETVRLGEERLQADLEHIKDFRPGYPFWQHIFRIADGRIAFGSARDGRLLATFPIRGDWTSGAEWLEPRLASSFKGVKWPRRLDERRELVVRRLEPEVGPLLSNPTRGLFVTPNIARYGSFVGEWGRIYERFGVPADIGLAQAVLESGLSGTVRSRANALGFCQWLRRNWETLDRLSPVTIEAYNQTTQAAYCAAYLSVLATMYGSFIPALSEHHAGGVNVGRTVINGERLGGTTVHEQYFMGSRFARVLRELGLRRYRDLYRTYGIRSSRYAEMVFGNTATVARIREDVPQERIHAMRTRRAISMGEITKRTALTAREVQRFNPALVRQVPRNATLYLPERVADFGADVSFWHRPADPGFETALVEFLQLEPGLERWHEAAFEPVLEEFRRRFAASKTEEGDVMATTLAYVIGDLRTSRRAAILDEFRASGRVLELFRNAVAELAQALGQD